MMMIIKEHTKNQFSNYKITFAIQFLLILKGVSKRG